MSPGNDVHHKDRGIESTAESSDSNLISHVTGESQFIADIPPLEGQLYGAIVTSGCAHARILQIDSDAARELSGVRCILTAASIPGKNQMGPVIPDEICLAADEVTFAGQAVVLVAADSEAVAREAALMISISYDPLEAVTTLEEAMERKQLIAPERKIIRGNPGQALLQSPHSVTGRLRTGAQEHWYLETQSALAVPGEGAEIRVFASSQNPSETQAIVAEVLGYGKHQVEVEVRRIGGGFGGKETQGNHVAAWASLLAHATRKPVKIVLKRYDDQRMTGKRHRFISDYTIGFDSGGRILGYQVELNADAGSASDLSRAILERSMLHAENAYFIPNISVTGRLFYTNLPSNTAFRGFGGPQGMAVIEHAIDRIARFLKKDAADIRRLNFYSDAPANITPYGQVIKGNHLHVIFGKIVASSGYQERRAEIDRFNQVHEFVKRGMALTPVKFGISFTTSFLNQAGALVSVYTDGTVAVNHGGTEMGQGLHEKIRRIASLEFGIDQSKITVTATNTSKVPNTSPTAASSGSDLNGMAVKLAIDTIKSRLIPLVIGEITKQDSKAVVTPETVVFKDNFVFSTEAPAVRIPFADLCNAARINQISLSSTGFYKIPGIFFDREAGSGNPFYYYSYAMAVSEVQIDVLTGNHRLLRTDILHDAGDSIAGHIDRGQITGGFIQGAGWCTMEEIKLDQSGLLLTDGPETYKIPTILDIPEVFNIGLLAAVPNPLAIHSSKAVGEPPFMLGLSVWLAIKDAISSIAGHTVEPEFSLPATGEVILLSAEKIRQQP